MSELYTNIRIYIGPRRDEDGYPVRAELDDGSVFDDGNLSFSMEDTRSAAVDPREYGLYLFDALFAGSIRRAYDKVTGRADAEAGGRVRIRLWIDDRAAELHAVPWERLYHIYRGREVALTASVFTPFSRYTGLEIPEGEVVREHPLRFLFAIANPSDLPPTLSPIDVERELELLRHALGDLQQTGQVEVTILPGRTGLSQDLRSRMTAEGYKILTGATTVANVLEHLPHHHVFHFLGHGHFLRRDRQGEGTVYLHLEQVDGRWVPVVDDEVIDGLKRLEQLPQLIFLAACESAKREAEAENALVGLGPKLVKAGVPAVVAMQDFLPVATARALTNHFYRRLLEHGVVDRALNEARHLLFRPDRYDWAIPVLFMRLRTGQLFAPDPVQLVLRAILARHESEQPPLAVEVAHLIGPQDPLQLAQGEQRGVPASDLLQAVRDIFAECCPKTSGRMQRGKLVVLVGAHGMAKTSQLHRIVSETARHSLATRDAQPIIPLYVDLSSDWTGKSLSLGPVEARVLDTLWDVWLDLEAQSLADLPQRDKGLRLRLLFDGTDDLTHGHRRRVWQGIQELARLYPQDEYLLAIDADHYVPRLLQHATDLLSVQPLSLQVIERFLRHPLNEPIGPRLYDALGRKQLFDLAAIPWLLAGMLEQARQGVYPQSRAVVLEDLVENGIAAIPPEQGMRSRARQTLYALAWAVQSGRKRVLSARETFEIMSDVRGNREYGLEDLYDALVNADLLVRVGEDSSRFYYPAYQYYCAAQAIANMPDRDQVLDDIAASLGRLTRLRWWEGTLVLLSGILPKARVLHRKLLYGARLNEGEEIFLIVRCLLESSEQQIAEDVRNQVVDALIWQLDSANVRRSTRRVRAAHALGQLRERLAIPYLVNVATQRVRLGRQGRPAYDLTNVRMAAAVALQRMMLAYGDEVEAANKEVACLLRLWGDQCVADLKVHLTSGYIVTRAIAAAALADLQTEEAVQALCEAVFREDTPTDTRWALTDALALLDPVRVTRDVIVPLIEAGAAPWYGRVAYLIGMTRSQDPTALAFLDRCLHELKRVSTKAQAIQSVGWLQDRTKTRLLEYVAMGRFDEIEAASRRKLRPDSDPEEQALAKGFRLGAVSPEQIKFLRRSAIEALAQIGDAQSLDLLREGRVQWDTELRRAFYWTSEEIYWREQVRRQS